MIDPWATVVSLLTRAAIAPPEQRAVLLAEAQITIASARGVTESERAVLNAELARIARAS